MSEDELIIGNFNREMEKKVRNFASDTLKDIENKSKMLNSTLNNIAIGSDFGSKIENDLKNLEKKIVDLSNINIRKKNIIYKSIKKILC